MDHCIFWGINIRGSLHVFWSCPRKTQNKLHLKERICIFYNTSLRSHSSPWDFVGMTWIAALTSYFIMQASNSSTDMKISCYDEFRKICIQFVWVWIDLWSIEFWIECFKHQINKRLIKFLMVLLPPALTVEWAIEYLPSPISLVGESLG